MIWRWTTARAVWPIRSQQPQCRRSAAGLLQITRQFSAAKVRRREYEKEYNKVTDREENGPNVRQRSENLITKALLALDSDFFAGDERDIYEHVVPKRLQHHTLEDVLQILLSDQRLLTKTDREQMTAENIFALYRHSQERIRLTDRLVVKFASSLYERGSYDKCVAVMLESLPMMDLVSAVTSELVPKYSGQQHQAFVLGNIGLALSQLGENTLVLQLLQEAFEGDTHTANQFYRVILEVEQGSINDALRGGKPEELGALERRFVGDAISLAMVHRWAYTCVAVQESLGNTAIIPKLLNRWFVAGDEGHFALRQVLIQLYKSYNSRDVTYRKQVVDGLARGIKGLKPHKTLRDEELLLIPQFGSGDVKAHQRLWRAFKHYLIRRPKGEGAERYVQTLQNFLFSATRLNQSYDIYNIVKMGTGSIFSTTQMSYAFDSLMWSGKKDPLAHDEDLYLGRGHVNPLTLEKTKTDNNSIVDLLARTIDACPANVAHGALTKTLERFHGQYLHNTSIPNTLPNIPPGKILWTLLGAVERSTSIDRLAPHCEQLIGKLVCLRPQLELLRLSLLQVMSDSGIVAALKTYIDALQTSHHRQYREIDICVILGTLVMLNERRHARWQKNDKAVDTPALGPAIADIFKSWDEKDALDMVRLLRSKNVFQPTNDEVSRTIKMMLKKNGYVMALEFLKLFPKASPSAYHMMLIHSSKNMPNLTEQLSLWLKKERGITTPPSVIRGMIKGFAASPRLSDAQSLRRIGRYMSVLRSQDANLGKKTAGAIVNSIIRRAQLRNHGSTLRLKWAFDLAQWEGVSEQKIHWWVNVLRKMQVERTGYFGPRRRPIRRRL